MKHVRVAVVGCLLVSTVVVGSPSAVAVPAPTAATCESGTNPGYAVYLTAVVDRAAAVLPNGAAIGFYDRITDTTCYVNPDRRLNTASIVKVLIATALQWRAQQDGRALHQHEVDTATTMITSANPTASNNAANDLWRQLRLEQPYVQEILDIMGLFGTTPSATGEWGLSETTARDQVILLRVLTSPDEVFLESERRDWVLGLMAQAVLAGQVWGVPVGTSPGVQVFNKIGYSELDGGFFDNRSHSIGVVRGSTTTGFDLDYLMAILTDGNPPYFGPVRVSSAAAVINVAKSARPV